MRVRQRARRGLRPGPARLVLLGVCGVVGFVAAVALARPVTTARAAAATASISFGVHDVNYADATLEGSATSSDFGFHVVIEWGRTTAYGSSDTFDTSQWHHFGTWASYPTWLDHDATYHARMVLHTEDGQTLYSPDVTFQTLPDPIPTLHNSNVQTSYDGGGQLASGDVLLSASFASGYATATGYVAWGTTPSFGQTSPTVTTTPEIPIGTGGEPQNIGFFLWIGSSCTANVTYYWHYVVANHVGVTTTPTESVVLPPLRPESQANCTSTTTTTPTTTTTTTTTPPPPPPSGNYVRPTMSSTTLPVGVVGVPYHYLLPLSDGSPPYTVLLNGDTPRMPPGLTLGTDGLVEGTPTSEGTFFVNIKVSDQRYPPTVAVASAFSLTIPITHPAPLTTTPSKPPFTPPTQVSVILPKRSLTPGRVNPAVRQSTTKLTICVANWLKTIRPPNSYMNALKLRQMKRYGETGSPAAYEEDHLIPLELGGAPRDPKNLWPEPHSQSKLSDPLETSLRHKVCNGSLTLAAAQAQILTYKRAKG